MSTQVVCVDVGSTFTKAALVELGSGRLIATASHRTTTDTDVMDGYDACRAALDADPALYEHAMDARVVLASPATLLAVLRTCAYAWQQDALTGNARELFEVGRELYARLALLGSHTAKLGRTLQRGVEDYNAMVGTLERRVLVTARRMNDLDLTGTVIDPPDPVEATPRTLTAVELLDDRSAGERRAAG